jgi:hypothetical protein
MMLTTIKELMRDWRYVISAVLSLIGGLVIVGTGPNKALWGLFVFLMAPVSLLMNFFIQRWSVRRLGGRDTAEDLRVTQKRVFTLDLPYNEAFDACQKSMESLRRCRAGRCDRKKGMIRGTTRASWRTIGDTVSYKLTADGANRTHVELTSHPRYHSTLVDYGSNYDNAERLTAMLGVKPEQYLLRAARGADGESELLRPASGMRTDSANLLRPGAAGEPEITHDERYRHESEHAQRVQQGTVSR